MGNLEYRVEKIEHKLSEVDSSFEKLFNALENKNELAAQGIFFEGQIFDAFHFVSKIIRSARSSIILIDNYVNDDTLLLFSKANKGALITIYTQKTTDQLKQAIMKFNKQFGNLTIQNISIFHDRFLFIDQKELYHIGSSLKDLGNKIFGFSKMNPQLYKLLAKLNESEKY